MPTEVSPLFQRMMSDHEKGFVFRQYFETQLSQGEFPDVFTVKFEKSSERKPDNWFHPSTHPLWSERQLYHYLANPDQLESEKLSYASRMAVTMGTAVHSLIEECVRMGGHMVPREGTCPACKRPYGNKKGTCQEYGAADLETGSRGHMDGVVKFDSDGRYWDASQPGVFELKSVNETKARLKLDHDLRIDTIREIAPAYYAQVQEYMRMTGMRQALLVFVTLGFPWDIYEYQIPYNSLYAERMRDKYLYVRQCVKEGSPPMEPCCGGKMAFMGKACPARYICGVGK